MYNERYDRFEHCSSWGWEWDGLKACCGAVEYKFDPCTHALG